MKVANKFSGEEYPKPPEGLHRSVCCDVVDRGLVDYEWKGKKGKRREVSLIFQIDAVDEETGEEIRRTDEKRFTVSSKFTASLAPNARLLAFLENWLGRSIPEDVRESGFDLEALIGRNAQIVVYHNKSQSNGKVYANIKGILPVKKSEATLEIEDYVRIQDREGYEPPYGSELWEKQHGESDTTTPAQSEADEEEYDDDDDLPF